VSTTEYRPHWMTVNCGDVRIDTPKGKPGMVQCSHGTTIAIDGKELTNVRAIDVRIRVGEVVSVTVERMPEARE